MRVNFEEKTYESYFNTELSNVTEVYFPIGQVQEGSLGFDSSGYLKDMKIWKLLGHPFFNFCGSDLREIADVMEPLLKKEIKSLPRMRANLLFQYKRPEYIIRKTGKEWSKWNKPYYRYDIYKKQQKLLMQIHSKLGQQVLVLYASPALHDVNDLVETYIGKEILEKSNFRKASELNNHHRNTYIQSGTHSVACSEPEKIMNFNLVELLESLHEIGENISNTNNYEFIKKFTKDMVSIINEDDYFSTSFRKLNDQYIELREYELLYSFLVMRNFRQLTGTQWIIKL